MNGKIKSNARSPPLQIHTENTQYTMTSDCSTCLSCTFDRAGVEGEFHVQRISSTLHFTLHGSVEMSRALIFVVRNYGEDLDVEKTIEISIGCWKVLLCHFARNCFIVELYSNKENIGEEGVLNMD